MSGQRQSNDFNVPEEPKTKETNVSEDPFANFGESIEISDDELPF